MVYLYVLFCFFKSHIVDITTLVKNIGILVCAEAFTFTLFFYSIQKAYSINLGAVLALYMNEVGNKTLKFNTNKFFDKL